VIQQLKHRKRRSSLCSHGHPGHDHDHDHQH
jgi:cobalt-zinc-cadmium efflux system protein